MNGKVGRINSGREAKWEKEKSYPVLTRRSSKFNVSDDRRKFRGETSYSTGGFRCPSFDLRLTWLQIEGSVLLAECVTELGSEMTLGQIFWVRLPMDENRVVN